MKSDVERAGLITAISCWFAVLLAVALHLSDPWWAGISAWIIASPSPAKLWQKGALRLVGTVAGCWLGYELGIHLEGNPPLQILALFGLTTVSTYLRFRSDYEYAWVIGGVSALLVFSFSLDQSQSLYAAAHYRAYEIACGVLSATLGPVLLRPFFSWSNPTPEPAAPLGGTLHGDHDSALTIALIGGGTVVLIVLLWSWFDLPSLQQSLITAVAVLNRDLAATRLRARLRLFGCLVGGAAGLVCAVFIVDSFALWSLLLIGGLAVFSRLHLSGHRWAYSGTQGGVAFLMVLVTGGGPPPTALPVIHRLAGLLVGVVVLLGVTQIVRFFSRPSPAPEPAIGSPCV